MRIILLICLSIMYAPLSWAKTKKLCPKNTLTIAACASTEGLPMFPYISVCQTDEGENLLAIYAGEARSVDFYHTNLSEEKKSTTFKISDTDGDNGELTILKTRFDKSAATFRYDFFEQRIESSYDCNLY